MRPVCECGRPVRAHVRVRKKSSRRTRAGAPSPLKDHYLCRQCWERHTDSLLAAAFAAATTQEPERAA